MFSSPGPIALDFASITVRWYGLLTALSFISCLTVADYVLRRRNLNISSEEMTNFAMLVIISGLIGARTWFVLLNYDYFIDHPLESFQIWLGGQSIQGGLIGATLGAFLFTSKEKLLPLLSTAAVLAPLGQAIGRWGNFFNEEAYGSVTELPWKLYISHTGLYHHPTFLYESIYNLIVFSFLFKISNKLSSLKLIASYIFLYSLGRIFLEELRTDSLYLGSFKAATVMSLIGILLGIFLYRLEVKSQHHR